MTNIIYHKFQQHTPEWYQIRAGKITCSILDKILTPAKLQLSSQATALAREIAAERIKGRAEESPSTFDMERGNLLEEEARRIYAENFGEVEQFGFIENTDVPFPFGCSPDGIIDGRRGGIEIKCPQAKEHLRMLLGGEIDGGYMLQMQGQMLAAGLEYINFISFNEGMKLKPIRVERNDAVIQKILTAGKKLEEEIQEMVVEYEKIEAVETELPEELE